MSKALSRIGVLGGWLLTAAADFVICHLVQAGSLFSDHDDAFSRIVTLGLVSFMFVYVACGFAVTSLAWWWSSIKVFRFGPPVIGAGSGLLLLVTLGVAHLFGIGFRFEDANLGVLLDPILVSGLILHVFATGGVAAIPR